MPTSNTKVSLLIDGKVHDDWEHYEIDSDLLIPADAFSVSLGLNTRVPPPATVALGALVEVKVGKDTVLVGHVDDINSSLSKNDDELTLSGRDNAAVLVDCSAPIFVARQVSLDEIIAKVIRPLGITTFRIDADMTHLTEKVNVDVGDKAWDVFALRVDNNARRAREVCHQAFTHDHFGLSFNLLKRKP